MALHDAVVDLQRGRVEYAVVGGSSAIFRPATSLAFLRLKCAWITSLRASLTPTSFLRSIRQHSAYLQCCEHAASAARAALVYAFRCWKAGAADSQSFSNNALHGLG